MNRRELLQGIGVGAAGVATLTQTGCATPGAATAPPVAAFDMHDFLHRMDVDLAEMVPPAVAPAVARGLVAEGLPESCCTELESALRQGDALACSAARTLYATSAFRDVPEELRSDPRLQQRLGALAGEMNDSVLGMRAYLASLGPADRDRLRAALRANPRLPEQICEALDGQVSQAWVQPERRRRQRMVLQQIAWRMQRQSPAAVIDEYLDKVARAEQHYQQRGAGGAGSDPGLASAGEAGANLGLWMMGIGAVVGGAGLLLSLVPNLSFIGWVGTTVGGALLLIGLIVWIAGAAMKAVAKPAASSPAPEATPREPGRAAELRDRYRKGAADRPESEGEAPPTSDEVPPDDPPAL